MQSPPPSRGLIALLATGAGFSVAALYYNQPMLGVIGAELHATPRQVGLIPTMTQLGYGLGIALLAPLGDRFDRKRIILLKAAVLAIALVASGFATDIAFLLAASLATGMAATMAQDIVPAAASIAPEEQRGKVVGMVMTGLLLGILLSRVVSGAVAETAGWRAMYFAATVAIVAATVACWIGLPRFAPTTQLHYSALLASMVALWRKHAKLRRASLSQGLIFMSFGAYWSTLAVMLGHDFHIGAAAAGSYGLAGAAGALAAPLAGRLADRHGPEIVARLGCTITAIFFAIMFAAPWLSPHAQLVLIAVSAVGFDFGSQAALIAHQTIVYGVEPPARSRLNALFFTVLFILMSTGAALGSQALALWGWQGVVALSTIGSTCALLVRLRRS
ncbi:MAG TPA: MFS transporter [Ramlibacter sp.]|jgi:predicted MFS family arabinose efflux permease